MEECSKKRKGKRKKSNSSNGESNSSNSSSNNSEMRMIRKGPWKAEEDAVLLNHVHKYGPRDWSSIRSKGLLLRTGKSCRLRWVNKLRPNLKTGCKFTAEEERIVIELQSQIGNKWATIATHLVGRTDNDVKNFWSSRQKRLARILHSQSPPRKKHKSSSWDRAHFHQVPKNTSIEGETSSKVQSLNSSSHSSASTETDSMKMVPLLPYTGSVAGSYPYFEANNTAILEPMPVNTYWNNMDDFRYPFPPETQELIQPYLSPLDYCTGGDVLVDDKACYLPRFDEGGMSGGKIVKRENGNFAKPDSFFDDFPLDMFDQIEPLPSPSNW